MALKKFTESPQWQLFTPQQRAKIENASSIAKQTELFNLYVSQLGAAPTTAPKTTTPTTPTTTQIGLNPPSGGWSHPADTGAAGEAYGQAYYDYWKEYQAYKEYQAAHPEAGLPYAANADEYAYVKSKYTGGGGGGGGGEEIPPEEAAKYTDDQIREYYDWLTWYSSFGQPGDWKPVSIDDFFNNYDTAQGLMSTFQQRQGEAEAESEYAKAERYGEAPEYQPAFTQWLKGQGEFSGALQEYIEKQYPSLRSEYEAGLSRLTGYPTREEARTEAEKRESGFQAWLTEQTPEIYQEYMGQRPTERGERLYQYAPTMRTVNW
jgi:hypothetical protein